VVYTAGGFDQGVSTHVPVTSGGTTTRDFAIRRDWAASKGGAGIVDISDDTGADFGCGGDQLIDQSEGVGWSAFNPSSADPANPHAGSPTVTIQLPQTITVRAFLADPAETCGDDPSSETKGYRIETSPNGVTWTVASQGNFAPGDAHRLNSLTPTAGTTGVRFVRLTALSPQSAATGLSGADFIDFTELEVLGGPPNVLPSGSLTATPSSIAPDGTVHFDASSFHDPDSLITGYSWDFDGNGTVDSTTSGPSTNFTYPAAGTFAASVTANDFVGGGGSATATVVVKGPAKPKVSIPSKGKRGKLIIKVTCSSACRVTATGTITSALRKRYHLSSRPVAKLSARLTKAGTKKLTLRINSKVRSKLKRRHVRQLPLSVRVAIRDATGQRTTRTHRAKITL
jgi:PKD repeat protein